jgi:hypothetical protein
MGGDVELRALNEFPDYYTRLLELDEEAEKYWEKTSSRVGAHGFKDRS